MTKADLKVISSVVRNTQTPQFHISFFDHQVDFKIMLAEITSSPLRGYYFPI